MSRYDDLVKKHGTYPEFEEAVWRTLGETSVAEVREACRKYQQELVDARLADLGLAPGHPEALCHCCGGINIVWYAPHSLWNQVMRSQGEGSEPYDGIVCPICFSILAREKGIDGAWAFHIPSHE